MIGADKQEVVNAREELEQAFGESFDKEDKTPTEELKGDEDLLYN